MTAVASAQAATAVPATTAPLGDKHFKEVFLMSSDGELETVLAREAKSARAMGLQPFVEIGASWCVPCQKLEQNMQHPKVEEAFRGTYIIHLDSDDWGNKLAAAGVAPRAIPVFFEIGEDGKSTGRRIQGGDWGTSIETMALKLHAFFRKA